MGNDIRPHTATTIARHLGVKPVTIVFTIYLPVGADEAVLDVNSYPMGNRFLLDAYMKQFHVPLCKVRQSANHHIANVFLH